MNNVDHNLFVASLAKGLQVLECFKGAQKELSLTEIVKRTDIGIGAAQRAVFTLQATGYLLKDEHSRLYRLAPKVLALSRSYLSASNIADIAVPYMRELSDVWGETVNLSEATDDNIVVIARIPGRQVLTINVGIGTVYPMLSTAPGLILLAFQHFDEAETIINRAKLHAWTQHTPTNKVQLLDWVKEMRADGHAVGNQLMHEGELSIAAPVFGGNAGKTCAALNLSAPLSRWTIEDAREKLVPAVVETAKKISQAMAAQNLNN
jgi:DNA-binding IclR family transcriptional regulator